jgi:hypothetical protein
MMIRVGNISLRLSDFPYFLKCFLDNWGSEDTKEREIQGNQLIAVDFMEQHLKNFIREVCRWGNYAGIAGRIINQNDIGKIRSCFIGAWKALNSDNPDVKGAIIRINAIKNLGTPSFASKHLRFLRPQVCPVLDSIIWQGIEKYSFNPKGYEQFSNDCLEIADILKRNGLVNPMERESGKWFAADVEMAIFEYLRSKSGSSLSKIHCRENH